MNQNVVTLNTADKMPSVSPRSVTHREQPEEPKLPTLHIKDVPTDLKAALVAVSRIYLYNEKGRCITAHQVTINRPAVALLKRGMESVLPLLGKQIAEKRSDVEELSEIARHFLDNPRINMVKAVDFAEGSLARRAIDIEQQDWERQCEDDEEPSLYPGLNREDALDCLSQYQRELIALEDAEAAIVKATESPRD